MSPLLINAQPGKILSLSFKLTNSGKENEDLSETLRLPATWLPLLTNGNFELKPGGSAVRIAAFQVPRDCPAGEYSICYSAQSAADPKISDEVQISVNVLPVTRLAMVVEDAPDVVIAGEDYKARVRIVNQSNAPVQVVLHGDSHKSNSPAVIEPSTLFLPTGGSSTATVTIRTDKRQDQLDRYLLQIRAQSTDDRNKSASASTNLLFDIIPRISGDGTPYVYVPAQFSYRTLSSNGQAAKQVVWSGGGNLGSSSTDSISIKLQTSDAVVSKVLGWRDEYRMDYRSKAASIKMGDQSYGLSYLTDYLHYGRGMGFDLHRTGRLDFGGYYMRTPWDPYDQGVAGAYVRRDIGGDTAIKLNLLQGNEYSYRDKSGVNRELWSLETTAKPFAGANIRAEYGHCNSDRDSSDDAYRVEFNSSLSTKSNFSFQTTHAGPNYHGYYQDRDYTAANLSVPIGPKLQWSTSYSTWRQNLDMRQDLGSAPKEQLLQMNLHCDLPNHWYTNLGYGTYRRQDLMPNSGFNYAELPIRLTVGNTGRKYTWLVEYRDGEREDFLAHTTSRIQSGRFFASYQPSAAMMFTLYADRSRSDHGGYLFPAGNSVGFATTIKPSDRFSLSAWYTDYAYTDNLLNTKQLELSATYVGRDDRSWNLRVQRFNPGSPSSDTTVELLYTVPMSLPVARRKDTGIVSGRVYDTAREGRPGIANAILYLNGISSVTDSDGSFSFPSVPAGNYSLKVDPKSIGLDHVTEKRMPLPVQVASGEVTRLELGVSNAVTLTGVISLAAAGTGVTVSQVEGEQSASSKEGSVYLAALPDDSHRTFDKARNTPSGTAANAAVASSSSGLENVVVEMANEKETIRRITDRKGSFNFESLYPGTWTLRVCSYNLPPNHYLKNPETQMVLQPGERRTVNISVLPRLRPIKMIGHETVINDEKAELTQGG